MGQDAGDGASPHPILEPGPTPVIRTLHAAGIENRQDLETRLPDAPTHLLVLAVDGVGFLPEGGHPGVHPFALHGVEGSSEAVQGPSEVATRGTGPSEDLPELVEALLETGVDGRRIHVTRRLPKLSPAPCPPPMAPAIPMAGAPRTRREEIASATASADSSRRCRSSAGRRV